MKQNTIRIAIADGQTVVRKGLTFILTEAKDIFIDFEVSNGKDLIDRLKNRKTVPDICILDVNMQPVNGFETLLEVKRRWPEMKVLVLTAFQYDYYIVKMILHGANGYVLKTCEPSEIIQSIYSIYTTGFYYSECVTKKYFKAIIDKSITMPHLTAREIQVLQLCCTEMTYNEMAVKLKTSRCSIEGYRKSLFCKTNINSRVGLALFAVKYGLVSLDINPVPERRIFAR